MKDKGVLNCQLQNKKKIDGNDWNNDFRAIRKGKYHSTL